jgi:hypothetical protein
MCRARIVGSTLGAAAVGVKDFPPCARGMEGMHDGHRTGWICLPDKGLDKAR